MPTSSPFQFSDLSSFSSTLSQWGSALQEGLKDNIGWRGSVFIGAACIGIIVYIRSSRARRNHEARIATIKTCAVDLKNFKESIKSFLPLKPNLSSEFLEEREPSQKEIQIKELYTRLSEHTKLLDKLKKKKKASSLSDTEVEHFQAEVAIIKLTITTLVAKITRLESEECREKFALEPNPLLDDDEEDSGEGNSIQSSNSSFNATKSQPITLEKAEKSLRKALLKLKNLESNLKEEEKNDNITELYKSVQVQIKEAYKWGTIYQVISAHYEMKRLVESAALLIGSNSLTAAIAENATKLGAELFTLQRMISPANYRAAQDRLEALNSEIEYVKEHFNKAEIAHEQSIRELKQTHEQKKQEVIVIQQQAQGFDTPIDLQKKSKTWQTRLNAAQGKLKELGKRPTAALTSEDTEEIARLKIEVDHYKKGADNDRRVEEMGKQIKDFLQSLRNKRSLDNSLLALLEELLANDSIATNLISSFAASSSTSFAPPPPPVSPSSNSSISLQIEDIDDAEYHLKRQKLKDKIGATFPSYLTTLKMLKKEAKKDADAIITDPLALLNQEFEVVKEEIESLLKDLGRKEAKEIVKLKEEAYRKKQAEREAKAIADKEADRLQTIKKGQTFFLEQAKAQIEPVTNLFLQNINAALTSAKNAYSSFTALTDNIKALLKNQDTIDSLQKQIEIKEAQRAGVYQETEEQARQLVLLQEKWELYSNSQKALISSTQIDEAIRLLDQSTSQVIEKDAEVRYGKQLNEALTKTIANLKLKLQSIRSKNELEKLRHIVDSEPFQTLLSERNEFTADTSPKKAHIFQQHWDLLASQWELLKPLFNSLPLEGKEGNKRKQISINTGIELDSLSKLFDEVQRALAEVTVHGKEKITSLPKLTTALEKITTEISHLLNKSDLPALANVQVDEDDPHATKFSEIVQSLKENQTGSDDTDTIIQTKLADVERAITTLKFALSTLPDEVISLEAEKAARQKEVAQLQQGQQAIEAAKKQMQVMQLSQADILKEIDRLQGELKTQTAMLNIKKNKTTTLEAEIKTLKDTISKLETTKAGISKKLQGRNKTELDQDKEDFQAGYEQALLNYVRKKLESEYAQQILAEVNQFNTGGVMFEKAPLIQTEQVVATTEQKNTQLAFVIAELLSQYGYVASIFYDAAGKETPSEIAELEKGTAQVSSIMQSTIENVIENFSSFIQEPSLQTYVRAKAALVAFNKMNDSGELQKLLKAAKTKIEKSTDSVQTSSAIGSSTRQGTFVKPGSSAMSTAAPAGGGDMLQELRNRVSTLNFSEFDD